LTAKSLLTSREGYFRCRRLVWPRYIAD